MRAVLRSPPCGLRWRDGGRKQALSLSGQLSFQRAVAPVGRCSARPLTAHNDLVAFLSLLFLTLLPLPAGTASLVHRRMLYTQRPQRQRHSHLLLLRPITRLRLPYLYRAQLRQVSTKALIGPKQSATAAALSCSGKGVRELIEKYSRRVAWQMRLQHAMWLEV